MTFHLCAAWWTTDRGSLWKLFSHVAPDSALLLQHSASWEAVTTRQEKLRSVLNRAHASMQPTTWRLLRPSCDRADQCGPGALLHSCFTLLDSELALADGWGGLRANSICFSIFQRTTAERRQINDGGIYSETTPKLITDLWSDRLSGARLRLRGWWADMMASRVRMLKLSGHTVADTSRVVLLRQALILLK